MSTIPSAEQQHVWVTARDQGQGEQPYCKHCGARKGPPEATPPCIVAQAEPRRVASDYDPFNF